ncbi:Uncharacterized ABC transporter ATP-binding protein YadG [hydrothermal vent metagenome]|uniref:Uncharacterized ABC transporter ATP-binding protein YadG n=1 Tax=hydrothermal vent metagenome TaxID=652676 RepID=A0A3B1CZ67_9ZZZZ
MQAISIKNLTKIYANGTEALKRIDLEVEQGDFFALLGANGAGKTTIIGILTGLVHKTGGEAKVFGHDVITQAHQAKGLIGVVPQEMNFNAFEQVQAIIVNQAGYFGIDYKTALRESEGLLKRLELWDKRHNISRNLSGGMKRRLMIARALITKPKLLILDEPTAGVDVELRHSMWKFLDELNKQGTTILLTTHYLEEVEQLCKNAAIIKDGAILVHDEVKNLVKMVERETYVLHVAKVKNLEALKDYDVSFIDDNTFEVDLHKQEDLHKFIERVQKSGMIITDIRPKGNRMEKLFLNVLKEEK